MHIILSIFQNPLTHNNAHQCLVLLFWKHLKPLNGLVFPDFGGITGSAGGTHCLFREEKEEKEAGTYSN